LSDLQPDKVNGPLYVWSGIPLMMKKAIKIKEAISLLRQPLLQMVAGE
jgi:hypothetical protein